MIKPYIAMVVQAKVISATGMAEVYQNLEHMLKLIDQHMKGVRQRDLAAHGRRRVVCDGGDRHRGAAPGEEPDLHELHRPTAHGDLRQGLSREDILPPNTFPERNKHSQDETWAIQTATVERLQREGRLEKPS